METARSWAKRRDFSRHLIWRCNCCRAKSRKRIRKGKKVLAVVPDNGERYLSTALYQEI